MSFHRLKNADLLNKCYYKIDENICHISINIRYNTISPLQKAHTTHLCHVKGHKIRITFVKKTWHWASLVIMMLTLKKTAAKVNFLHYEICRQSLCTSLYLSLHYSFFASLRIVGQPVFNINAFLLRGCLWDNWKHSFLRTREIVGVSLSDVLYVNLLFFISRIKQMYTKPINVSENILIVKMKSC